MKLLPFDLEKAKAGARVVTTEKQSVRILCYDGPDKEYPLVGFVEGCKLVRSWNERGRSEDAHFHGLFLAEEEDASLTQFETALYCFVKNIRDLGKITEEELVETIKKYSSAFPTSREFVLENVDTPRWQHCGEGYSGFFIHGGFLYHGHNKISLQDLAKLPKTE